MKRAIFTFYNLSLDTDEDDEDLEILSLEPIDEES